MQLEEFYDSIGGSYPEVKKRIPSDKAILHFIVKFPDDSSYEKLCQAVEKKDYEEAYKAVHTLKGISQNLSFKRLGASAGRLSAYLRRVKSDEIDDECYEELRCQVSKDYEDILKAICGLQE